VSAVPVEHVDELQAYSDSVAGCVRCRLSQGRTQVVFGAGNPRADLMFVGEAPGFHEDKQGLPFVGQAGKLLEKLLAQIGMQRSDVYIANVLKCRPPGNRDPEPLEVQACLPYLDRQIALIQPKLIVALGKSAATTLLRAEATIASLRGRIHRYNGIPLIVTYHPAYLLRSLPDKAKAWEDLCLARATLRGILQPGIL
jgi:uracil-DNA glycosylase family 4